MFEKTFMRGAKVSKHSFTMNSNDYYAPTQSCRAGSAAETRWPEASMTFSTMTSSWS